MTWARFDLVAAVDWSAAAKPTGLQPKADAIWIGLASAQGEVMQYHRTRHAAEIAIRDLIGAAQKAGQSLLLGFDFPMGYPAGFAHRLTGAASAPAVWRWLDAAISDAPDNANNRFAVANAINLRFADGKTAGPFWGRPRTLPLSHLPETRAADYTALGLAERRTVEVLVPRAQAVWKLYTTGAVGSQSLMGLPLIHRLSQLPGAAVWPFAAPSALTIAEIYPSLLGAAVAADEGAIKDEVQVRLLSRALWRLGQSGGLTALLDAAPTQARQEEGWILGAGDGPDLRAAL